MSRTPTRISRGARRRIRLTCAELVASAKSSGATPDLGDLLRRVGEMRCRPVSLAPLTFAGSTVFGMVVALPEQDLVLFERRTTPSHQLYIVFHELAHLLLGHDLNHFLRSGLDDSASADLDEASNRAPEPPRGPVWLPPIGSRSDHGTESSQEQEAEYFAQVLFEMLRSPLAYQLSAPANVVSRMTATLLGGGDHHVRGL